MPSDSDLRQAPTHFLIDLLWSGSTYRVSTSERDVTDVNDNVFRYSDGLSFSGSWTDGLDLFAISPNHRSISLTLDLQELVDVPARVAEGHDLGGASAKLWVWNEQSPPVLLLDGEVRQVEWGDADEPVTITLEEAPLRSPGRVPSELHRVLAPGEFDNLSPRVLGQYYPVIFGYPGGPSGWGSPALQHDSWFVGNGSMVVGAYACIPGNVLVVNDDDDSTMTVAVQIERDNNQAGALRTAIDVTDPPLTATSNVPYYLRWTKALGAGGIPSTRDPSVPMRGAGEIMLWLMERSGARIDYGRMAALEVQLASYLLDAAIVPGDSERVAPIEWIERHLLPILPVSARVSHDGLYYQQWRWDAVAEDSVAIINADEQRASRVGAVEESDRDDLAQEIRLDYLKDYRANAHAASLTYTWDVERGDPANGVVVDPRMEASFQRYARGDRLRVREMRLRSDVIVEASTAHLVIQHLTRRFGILSRLVRYEADWEFGWLTPGDVVTVNDAELGLSGAVALVETVVLTSQEHVGLGIRILGKTGV